MTVTTETRNSFVARQPIFTVDQSTYAYELLFRAGDGNFCPDVDPDQATLDVVRNSFLDIGLSELTGGKRAFINFPERLLLNGTPEMLPPDAITVEILEDVEDTPDVVAKCREYRANGYQLALDDFVLEHLGSAFLEVSDIVKVDFMGTDPAERKAICKELKSLSIQMLAEKVETPEEFEEARQLGFTLFQGYYFAKPVIRTGKSIQENQILLTQLLCELSRPSVSMKEIERIVKRDVGLTFKLLRLINSTRFGLRHRIESIRQALYLLGPKEIKKWLSVVALKGAGAEGKSSELIAQSMFRARACEQLAHKMGQANESATLFLVGMLSHMDAMLDQPMEKILAQLPVDDLTRAALLGEPNRYRVVLDLCIEHESGRWERFDALCEALSLSPSVASSTVAEARIWADDLASALMA